MIKKNLLILCIFIISTFIIKGQNTCGTALPFCTGTNYTFPASTNTPPPTGAYFDCLFSQPNPAFYFCEIDNPGNMTINIQGLGIPNGTNDIDFICWGPFTNPATMCNQLTAANVEDCSYSGTWNEFCDITGASTGDYYVLLITNYSNSACNITFSQTGGNATTNCCILGGDAGDDNTLDICDTYSQFNMLNQLLGTPDNGGAWYNDTWVATGSNNFDPANSVSGTYAYVVQGSSSACPDDTSFLTININPTPILNFPTLNDVCSDNTPINLSAATPLGGAYSGTGVNTNIFTPNINILGNNIITYNYTDANGCSNSITQNITVNPAPFAYASTTNATCNGLTNGTALITISGGTPNYSTNWGGNNPLSLSAGMYGYTVTDINGCTFSDSIIIYEPSIFTASVNTTNVSCNGDNNGTASIQLQGSSTPTTGTVSTLSYCTSTSGSNTNSTIENVQLTGDIVSINNNTTGICDQYEDYTNLYADLTEGQAYTIDVDLGDCSNNYSSAGKVYIDWNIDGDFNDPGEEVGIIPYGIASSASISITVPFSGAYGATRMRVVSQFLNSVPVSSIGPCDVGVMANPIYIQPWFGATEDYSLVISPANITATYNWSNGLTTDSISGLSAGSYMVDITNANGCTLTDYITITEPPAISTITSQNNISCFGYSDGSISLTISGGIPDYTINAATYSQTLVSGASSFTTPSLLSAGIYPYTVTDSNGCIFSSSVTIIEPAPISVTEIQNNVSCNGLSDGNVALTINGGTPTYSENWGANNSAALSAGSFNYIVTDNNGCIYSNSVIITEPDLLVTTFTQTNVSTCSANDGSINITVSGGTNPYTYSWNNGSTTEDLASLSGGNYILTVTDDKGCTSIQNITITEPPSPTLSYTQIDVTCDGGNDGSINLNVNSGTSPFSYTWTNGDITEDITGLIAGQYTVQVEDGNGCIESITMIITEPIAPNISVTQIDPDCNGNSTGSIDLTIVGSALSYTTLWNSGQATEDINNLSAGNYTCTITDINACTDNISVTIIDPPLLLTSIGSTTDVSCYGYNDGSISITATGGTPGYQYSIDGGTTWSISNVFSGLIVNPYTIDIKDANNCPDDISTTIIEPPLLVVSIGSTIDVSCFGMSDGEISINTAGGIPAYQYSIDGGTTWSTSNIFSGLTASIYSIDVQDANSCTDNITVNIIQPNNGVSALATFTEPTCYGYNDGSISVVANGGNPSYQYSIDSGITWPTSNVFLGLTEGPYTINIKDANNCTDDVLVNISEPTDIQINPILSHVSCFGQNDGTSILQISGGTSPYTENWNGVNISSLSAGSYLYSVTDNNTCVKDSFITITEPETLRATATITNANCFNSSDGKVYLTITGGTTPYTEDFGTFNPFALEAGIYTFNVTDIKGCQFDSIAVVEQANIVSLSLSAESPICRNDSTEITINISNPSHNIYTITIEDSIQQSFVIDSSGNLIPEGNKLTLSPNFTSEIVLLSITDADGCESNANDTVKVIVNQLPILNLNLTNICEGTPSFLLNQGTPSGGAYLINGEATNFFDVESLDYGNYIINYEYTDALTNCSNVIEQMISINPSPKAEFTFSPQPANIDDPNILFISGSNEIENSSWDLGDGTIIMDETSFWHNYADTGKYEVTYLVNNQFNCTDTLRATLIINPVYQIFIPNSFTPNDDGDNDVFQPYINGAKKYTITIFNRWGGIIFQQENGSWDGTLNGTKIEDGVYSYSILVNDFKDKPFTYSGNITLLK